MPRTTLGARGCRGSRGSLDADRLDLVADLDAVDHIHAGRDLTEVRVLLIEERRVLLDEKELRIVVEGRFLSASDACRSGLEREIVVLARHALTARPGTGRIATLNDPVLDAGEDEVVVEAASGFLHEARDGLRRLVGAPRERDRPALCELDGGLGGTCWCGSRLRTSRSIRWR